MCKYLKITLFLLLPISLYQCTSKVTTSTDIQIEGEKIAYPITYKVLVNNPNPEDEWTQKCLENIDINNFAQDVIDAVLDNNLIAYDFFSNQILSVAEVKDIISHEDFKTTIGNIQFTEEWYWDKQKLALTKSIQSIMFGYEIYNSANADKIRGYRASFVVNMPKISQ